jgi:ABC-type multidrug transport system permease subunit
VGSPGVYLREAVRKDLVRRLRDPAVLAIWLGIPLVLGTLITAVSSGAGGGQLRAKVLVVDQDRTFASELLTGVFQQGPAEGLFEARAVELEEGRELLDEGEASALLVIPAGFSEALFEEVPAQLELVTNPAQRILPGLVEETLKAVCDLAFYAQRVLGEQVQRVRAIADEDRGPTQAEVADIAIEVRDALERVETLVFPPALELSTEPLRPERDEPVERPSPGRLILPGILLMALLFVAQGTSEDLWEERERGTLRRAASSPVPLWAWLAGKLAAAAVVMLGVALAAGLIGVVTVGLDPLRALVGVLWAALTATSFAVLMLLLQALAGTRRGGSVLGMLVLFPLLMLGGSFFPFAAMPAGLARIGQLTPNGLALVQLERLLDGTADAAGLLGTAGVLLGSAALLFVLLVARVRRAFVEAGG